MILSYGVYVSELKPSVDIHFGGTKNDSSEKLMCGIILLCKWIKKVLFHTQQFTQVFEIHLILFILTQFNAIWRVSALIELWRITVELIVIFAQQLFLQTYLFKWKFKHNKKYSRYYSYTHRTRKKSLTRKFSNLNTVAKHWQICNQWWNFI